MLENLKKKRGTKMRDETGNRYGRLIIISYVERRGTHQYWLAKCDCGNDKVVSIYSCRYGAIKSCGCLSKEGLKKGHDLIYKHGKAGTKTYYTWFHMIRRCHNQEDAQYYNYGARGIHVCQRWRDSYENFLEDMGESPKDLSLERIDNDKGYSPDNCRWATRKEQGNNKRTNRRLTLDSETLTVTQWSNRLNIPINTIINRLNRGYSVERALSNDYIRR